MSTTGAASQRNAVHFMVDFHSREKRLGLPAETLARVASLAPFRETESQNHYLEVPTNEGRRRRKALLATLIPKGERLLQRARDAGGLPGDPGGLKTADPDSMVEELRTTQLLWEGDMTPRRHEQIPGELFYVTQCSAGTRSHRLVRPGELFRAREEPQ